MKISTKLRLAVYIPTFMSIVIILALVFSYQEMRKIMDSGDAVRQMRSSITELNHFVFSYIHYHEERPKQQFMAEHAGLIQQITNMQLDNPDQQNLLDNIHKDVITVKDLFSQLVANNEHLTAGQADEHSITEDRLAGLLLYRSYQADVDAALLRSLVDDGIRTTEETTIGLILVVLFLTAIPITIILVSTRRGIVSSLSNLNKGAAIIGSGNLDYTIDDKKHDEIGDLSRSFNLMTTNLKDITTSKSMLEKEIEDRKRTENLLLESEESLKRAQEIAHLGSWELNLIDNRLSWSDEIYRIFDLKPQEFPATYEAFLDAIHPDDRALVDTAYSNSVREGRDSYEIEHRIIRKSSGEIRYVHERCIHIKDNSGKIIRSVGMVHDITERKKAEEEVKQRTAELEVSNRELEAFSYSVSHDLRAPLRSMEGFSSALLEDYADKLDDHGKQYLRYIQESSDLMARLIDDLLRLSRITRSEMNFEKVNLSSLAQNIAAELETSEPHRKGRFIIASDINANGDLNLLRLVLDNLLGNAWKFSSKTASPVIEVGTIEDNGRQVYFVRDNGVGFDMNYGDKLFKPFQRLHKASEFAGTGIGLATVHRIIHRHGGEVWAESRVGEGATFYFTVN